MNYLQASRFASKAYCEEESCKRSTVVTRMAPDRKYIVECSRDPEHPLNMTKTLFAEYLDRWRQGERLFSLEDLIFTNTLRVMQRQHPARWDYEVGNDGAVIRICDEWWPGYKPTEEEKTMVLQRLQEQGLSIEGEPKALALRLAAKWPRDLKGEQAEQFLSVCRVLSLNPWLGEIVPFQGVPYVTVKGYVRKARESGRYAGLKSRPATQDEWHNAGCIDGDILWTASVQDTAGNEYQAWGKVTLDERNEQRTNDKGQQYYVHPVLQAKPMEMAENRAIHDALERSGMLFTVAEDSRVTVEDFTPDHILNVDVVTGEISEGDADDVPAEEDNQAADFAAAMDAASTQEELDATAALIADAGLSPKDRASLRTTYSRNKVRIEQSQGTLV